MINNRLFDSIKRTPIFEKFKYTLSLSVPLFKRLTIIKMPHSLFSLACASLLFSTPLSAPSTPFRSPNASVIARNVLLKRAEPTTGDDLPDTPNHPNRLDQVETAFNDASELVSYVIINIDIETTIFPHYFDEGDRVGVKNMFAAILGTTSTPEGPGPGNDLLGNIHVQTTDTDDVCGDGTTLAYMNGQDTDNP